MTISNILLVKEPGAEPESVRAILSGHDNFFDIDEIVYAGINSTIMSVETGSHQFVCLYFKSDYLQVIRLIRSLKMVSGDTIIIILVLPSLIDDSVDVSAVKQQAFDAGVTEIVVEHRLELLQRHVLSYVGRVKPRIGRILFVHPSEEDSQDILDAVRSTGYLIDIKRSAEEAWAAYRYHHYDLVVTEDILTGLHSSTFLISSIRQLEGDSGNRPIIVMQKSRNNDQRIQALLDMGASEVIKEPVEPELLLSKMAAHINNLRRVRSERYSRDAGAPLFDVATQTMSRQALTFFWSNFMAISRRTKADMTFVLVSVEGIGGFKEARANSVEATNALLMNIVESLQYSLREEDTMTRWSERVFGIVLMDCPDEVALNVIKRSIDEASELLSLSRLNIALNAGIVSSESFITDDIEDVANQAKMALMASVSRGDGHVVSFTELA